MKLKPEEKRNNKPRAKWTQNRLYTDIVEYVYHSINVKIFYTKIWLPCPSSQAWIKGFIEKRRTSRVVMLHERIVREKDHDTVNKNYDK